MKEDTIKGKRIYGKDHVKEGYVTYEMEDGTTEDIPVKIIESRIDAIKKCKELTIELLKRDDAYDFFQTLCKDFSRHRNYEIEHYLNECSGYTHSFVIRERCPFNGWSTEEFLA